MRRIVMFGLCALAVPMLAAGQTQDDFEFWDRNNNGDLTCSEAKDGPDGGLRLPAYRDNRDGTGVIYEWLERSRSSDTDNDGVACESTPNAGGYIPNVQPVEPQGCSADAETWRGLQVCEEQPRDGYDRDAFGSGYSSLEDDIIAALPATMKAGGQVYTPYSCLAFGITADGTAATDIEHIVALAEAHDSRIADDRRRDIASDLDNLTIADPTVNRSQKSDRDAADWMPARHGRWFAERVIAVKLEYGLSVDSAERAALEALLSGGGAVLNCVNADTTSPTVVINSDASAPVTGPFPIAIAFSDPVTGFELEDLVVGNGSASQLQGSQASYTATITPEASGTVTVDIAAGVAQDSAGNPSAAADQFSIVADLTSVPMNRSPAPAGTLPNPTMGPDDTLNVDVSQAFVDPDDDALTHTVSSSAPQVVRGERDRRARDAGGRERGCGHDPGDGDRPRRSERGAVVHGHGGDVAIRAFHRPPNPARSDAGQGRPLHGATGADRRFAKSGRTAGFSLDGRGAEDRGDAHQARASAGAPGGAG